MSHLEKLIPTLHPDYAERLKNRMQSPCQALWGILDNVVDPELPTVTIWNLGILQNIQWKNEQKNHYRVTITPTYSGCPAVETIQADIINALEKAGYTKVDVDVVLSPAWSTEMISPVGKKQLQQLHIAPPDPEDEVSCPICGSNNTQVISRFGSTACKALYQCGDCHEPFDYFKYFD